jgi:hypothetical protein
MQRGVKAQDAPRFPLIEKKAAEAAFLGCCKTA